MRAPTFRRRDFLASSALTTLAVGAGALAACATRIESSVGAGSAADDLFAREGAHTLIRMARLLYPHDAISDDVYARVVEQAMGARAPLIDDIPMYEAGLASLDGARGRPFLSLREREQIAVLREIEGAEFFSVMRSGVQAALYEQPEVWALIGYPGSAIEFGGYWDKGFDDISWLPAQGAGEDA